MNLDYDVIATGSTGNCVRLMNMVIDAGIPQKNFPWEHVIDEDDNVIGFVYLTHTHSDHVKAPLVRKLLEKDVPVYVHESNRLRRSKNPLHTIKKSDRELWDKIIFVNEGFEFDDGYIHYEVELTHALPHNVPCFGVHVKMTNVFDETLKLFYATDMGDLLGVVAPNYDYYFVETNYCQKRLKELEFFAKKRGQYNRYQRSKNEHMSKQQAYRFYNKNKGEHSKFIALHKSDSAYR